MSQWRAVRDVTYSDASARGQLRIWKSGVADRWDAYSRAVTGSRAPIVTDVIAFDRKGSIKGKQRAFHRINTRLTRLGAVLEFVHYDPAIACWSILRPRHRLLSTPRRHSDAQDCVAVNAICITPQGQGVGMATLEITDHAAGRALERSPGVDLSALVFAAHHTLLALEPSALNDRAFDFLLPAGNGCFKCEVRGGYTPGDRKSLSLYVFAATYLAKDMLSPRQIEDLCGLVRGLPGNRLADKLFLPTPLRQYSHLNFNWVNL